MDPNANLKEQLELARLILDPPQQKSRDLKFPPLGESPDAERLAELVEALDKWIQIGGFLPSQWNVDYMAQAFHLTTDGGVAALNPAGQYFTLEELQKAVGGYIELVTLPDGRLFFCNEEGKLHGAKFPFNPRATLVFMRAFPGTDDAIMGDVVICPASLMEQ